MKQQKRNSEIGVHMRKKRNKSGVFIAALLGVVGILPLAANTGQDGLPGMGIQPVEYFYTGKPYDVDSDSYTFRYRNYDPELNRWTTVDPSGFPDGANNLLYVRNPYSQIDREGLQTVDNITQALDYWRRENGSTSDAVTFGLGTAGNVKNSSGFQELIYNIQVTGVRLIEI